MMFISLAVNKLSPRITSLTKKYTCGLFGFYDILYFVMAKMTVEQKRARIKLLEREIEEREKEIHELLEVPKPSEISSALPDGFALTENIFSVIQMAYPNGIDKEGIRQNIKNAHGISISNSQIQSSLAYLKNTKDLLEIVGRGLYKYKKPTIEN